MLKQKYGTKIQSTSYDIIKLIYYKYYECKLFREQ